MNSVSPGAPGAASADPEDGDPFVPLRSFRSYFQGDRRERDRERRIAERVGDDRARRVTEPPHRARGLSVDGIVDAAIAVADAEGADAVSMRRIARELRAGAMSLYWYVSSKDELHELMVERVQAEAEVPVPSGDWRADLRGFARNLRAALLRHPWAMDFLVSGPPSGPNDARNAERLFGAVSVLGVDPVTAVWIAMTVGTYVQGAVLREVREIRWECAAEEASESMTEDEIATLLADFHKRVRDSGRYPHLTALMDCGLDPDSPDSRDERFEFGLDCVLDGIGTRFGDSRRES
ncbi:MAG TPA: TetR/AcrR family transcriptional regulator [Trebonia sp.]